MIDPKIARLERHYHEEPDEVTEVDVWDLADAAYDRIKEEW